MECQHSLRWSPVHKAQGASLQAVPKNELVYLTDCAVLQCLTRIFVQFILITAILTYLENVLLENLGNG